MLLLTQFSFADDGKNCNRSGKFIGKLDLQEDQVDAVEQVMKEQQEKRRELLQTSRDAIKEKLAGIHDETKNKLSVVLTPEQLAEYEALHAKRMEKREQRKQERQERFKNVSQTSDNASAVSI